MSWWSRSWRVALAAGAVWAAGCGAGAGVACEEEACPAGWTCGVAGCEPLPTNPTTGALGRYTSTGLLSDGRLVVASYDQTHGNLVVSVEAEDGTERTRPVDGWRVEGRAVVDTDSGRWASLAVDGQDGLHAVWFDVDEGALHYGRATAAGDHDDWEIEVVDGAGPEVRGTHTSLVVAQGIVYVAYRDETARQLRYARRDADGTWTTRALDGCADEPDCPRAGEEDYGEWASLALIAQRPRIAFYDRLRGDLKMATRDEYGAWVTTTLDGRDALSGADTGDVGRFISLALTPERQPALAYYDATRGALRFLGPGGAPLVVDAGVQSDAVRGALRKDPVGQHAALRFDARGRAIVLYLDAGAPAVKQAVISANRVVSTRTLGALAPGGFLSFHPVAGDQLRGAYGAWVEGDAPRTRLVRFLLPVYEAQ